MEYTVSEYREEHHKQIVALHSLLINTGRKGSLSYLSWKYRKNPFIQPPLIFVVLRGEEVVGMRGLVGTPWDLVLGDDPIVLPHADDLIIHPDHRNRGLFLKINQAIVNGARERGFPAIISLSGGHDTQELSLVTGWKQVGDLDRVYRSPPDARQPGRPSSPGATLLQRGRSRLRGVARSLGYAPGKPPSERWVDGALSRLFSRKNSRIGLEREADHEGMSALARSLPSMSVRADRSETFLRWRLSKPDRRYRFLYWQDSGLRGYMVLGFAGRSQNRVMIVDHAVEDEAVFTEFLDALAGLEPMEIQLMSSTLPRTQLQAASAAGFEPDPSFEKDQRRRFLFFPLTSSDEAAALVEAQESYPALWRLSLLDTMGG